MEQDQPPSSNVRSSRRRRRGGMVPEAVKIQNQQIIEELREAVRLRMMEMRRAIRTRGPSVDGIIWTADFPEDQTRSHLLSLLRFEFKPGIDILDTSSVPRKLWNSSLQYVGSIPGCISIGWGQLLTNSTSILCIIQWDNVKAWRNFQHSFGFGLIAVLLAKIISDDCMKLHSGKAIEFGERPAIMEEVSFSFESRLQPEDELKFEAYWADLRASFPEKSLQCIGSNWLEQRVSVSRHPTAEQIAASSIPVVFAGILVWEAGSYDSQILVSSYKTLEEKFAPHYICSITQIAAALIQERVNKDDGALSVQLPPVYNNLSSILKTEIRRQFSTDHGVFDHIDRKAENSIEEARQRSRLFPAPRSYFYAHGRFSEDKLDHIAYLLQLEHHDYDKEFIVDVLWLRFIPDAVPRVRTYGGTQHTINEEDLSDLERDLQSDISLLSGYVATFWAEDVEEQTSVALLTVWNNPAARLTSIQQYRQITKKFALLSSDCLAMPPEYQIFPLRHPSHLYLISYLELISFSVMPGELNRQLFEHAYRDFERTTEHIIGGTPMACRPLATGGWLPSSLESPRPANSVGSQRFTGAFVWESAAARQEWYRDLFQGAASYERFGYKLDRLQILAVGDVESRFISLSRFP